MFVAVAWWMQGRQANRMPEADRRHETAGGSAGGSAGADGTWGEVADTLVGAGIEAATGTVGVAV